MHDQVIVPAVPGEERGVMSIDASADEGKAWFSDVASITVFDSFQASGAKTQSNLCREPSVYT